MPSHTESSGPSPGAWATMAHCGLPLLSSCCQCCPPSRLHMHVGASGFFPAATTCYTCILGMTLGLEVQLPLASL